MSKDKAADYFARHKESPECHITSDGRVFHSIGTATGFANGLKDNAVTSYKRGDMAKPTKIIVHNTDDEDLDEDKETRFKARVDRLTALGFERNEDLFSKEENGGTTSIDSTAVYESTDKEFEIGLTPLVINGFDESKVKALEALKKFDTATATYPEIKALSKALALESPSQSQVDLVAAIEAQKVIINTEVKA